MCMSYPRSHSQFPVKGICFMDLAQVVPGALNSQGLILELINTKAMG